MIAWDEIDLEVFRLASSLSLPVTVKAQDSFAVAIEFNPTTSGEMTYPLVIETSVPSEIQLTLKGTGVNLTTGVSSDNDKLPETFELSQNFPNPFNPMTEISFQLLRSDKVTFKIYNLLGQEIRTLADGQFAAGIHTVRWNGKDNSGNRVTSGIFIYRIHTDSFSQIKKMLLVK